MEFLLIAGAILLACAMASKVMYRFGIPTLIIFLTIGMLMGSDGIGGIYFDNSYLAQNICNFGLLFIIFFGGFGTSWKAAKPVSLEAGVLATLGVVLTALLVGLFAHYALGLTFLEGMLMGSIVASTDAASVFSILRSRQLNLKHGLAPLLEMESGSNDPVAYMLTIVLLGLITGQEANIGSMLLSQTAIGVLMGLIVGQAAVWLINHIQLEIDGLYSIIAIGIALLSFSGADLLGGNGFLAVYITGMIMGNSRLVHKVSLVRYFDGLSWLMQILLFFTLGLLVFPSKLPGVAWPGLATAAFLTFIARPLAVCSVLSLFKRPIKDQLLVAWTGFRGAASIVFATYPLTAGLGVADDIFNTVFFVAIVSVLVQGSLFVPIAKKLDLVAQDESVLKTFTDYSGEIRTELLEVTIDADSLVAGKTIMELDIPEDTLIVMIRRSGKLITPRGTTVIKAGDALMVAGENKAELLSIGGKST